jgi:hypothetical protein
MLQPDPALEARLKRQRAHAILGTLMGTAPTVAVGDMLSKDVQNERDLNAEIATKAADLLRRSQERAEDNDWKKQTQADLQGYRNASLDIQRGREQRLGQQGGITPYQQEQLRRRDEALAAAKEAKINAGVTAYNEDLSKIQGFQSAISQADAEINKYRKSGKVPGVGGAANLPGFLGTAVAAFQPGGMDLRRAVAGVENQLLQARSGGAVTPQEADRLKSELGKVTGATDAQFIAAWDAFKARNADVLRGLESKYTSDVLEEKKRRDAIREGVQGAAPSAPTQAAPQQAAPVAVYRNGKRVK